MLISVFSRNNYELDVFYKFVLNKTVQSFRVHSYVSLELCMCLGKLIIILIMTSIFQQNVSAHTSHASPLVEPRQTSADSVTNRSIFPSGTSKISCFILSTRNLFSSPKKNPKNLKDNRVHNHNKYIA